MPLTHLLCDRFVFFFLFFFQMNENFVIARNDTKLINNNVIKMKFVGSVFIVLARSFGIVLWLSFSSLFYCSLYRRLFFFYFLNNAQALVNQHQNNSQFNRKQNCSDSITHSIDTYHKRKSYMVVTDIMDR